MNPARYVTVDEIRVDLAALRALAHTCTPEACFGNRKGCCESYEIYIDRGEMSPIVGAMPAANRYRRGLMKDGVPIDPFEETDDGHCLATNDHGRCLFAYRDKQGRTLCSLHSVALDAGLPPVDVKPLACALWPLYLAEGDPMTLTVQDDALEFPCNTHRGNRSHGLHHGVREIVEGVFGTDFLDTLEARL